MKTKPVKELSIQISLSGLSFCIINKISSEVEFLKSDSFQTKQTPQNLLNKLKTVFETHSVLEQNFDNVLCIHQNELSCLVPENLFDERHLADYLKFNAKILKTDFISFDPVESISAMNVYVPLVNVNNYLFDTFGSFTFKHSSSILIDSLSQLLLVDRERIFININKNTFELLSFKGTQLVFYNIFQYHTPQDFIYYLLFTLEQLELNPETIKLYLVGEIQENYELYKIIYKYIRFVEVLNYKSPFNVSQDQNIEHQLDYFLILNSFK